MFKSQFSHYLSYGASDQNTVTELRDVYEGILVPGTVAAFQKEGTGGFVLSLSASKAHKPYVIDPRSPLFQQIIDEPKKSHIALANILGLPDGYSPSPKSFNKELIKKIAANWVAFNTNYQSEAGGKFKKYAERLGEEDLDIDGSSPPNIILPPYFVANSTNDEWWKLTTRIYGATCEVLEKDGSKMKCVRVVATDQVDVLDSLCESLPENEELVIWVSGLNELKADVLDLAAYGNSIRNASNRGQNLFALYGGFFAVLLSTLGLRGVSHGIGYGESRRWIELPKSGPPPQRYYIKPLHRYVNQELAEQLWKHKVFRCDCPICKGTTPLLLKYHDIMKHSVYCRDQEIKEWGGLSIQECHYRLHAELPKLSAQVTTSSLAEVYRQQVVRSMEHLPYWLKALALLSKSEAEEHADQ